MKTSADVFEIYRRTSRGPQEAALLVLRLWHNACCLYKGYTHCGEYTAKSRGAVVRTH